MSQKKMMIEVLAPDGESVRRVLWISMYEDGISIGYVREGERSDQHWTYHSDGGVVFTGGGTKWRQGEKPRLDKVKGIDQLITIPIPVPLKDSSAYPIYSRKSSTENLEAVIYVDDALFPHGGVACTLYVVEPHRAEHLPRSMTRGITYVCTHWTPWVVLVFSHLGLGGVH